MKELAIIAALVAISAIPLSFAESGTYPVKADGKSFDVSYNLEGDIVAIDADTESTSLLIGVTNVQESTFEVTFPSELLAAHDAQFVVLVDGLETDYAASYNGNNPTITVPIPADTEEIEIIGTSVVPEFPLGVVAIMGVVSGIGLLMSRNRLAILR